MSNPKRVLPREHGSWAVLIAPIIVGLTASGGGAPGPVLCFCLAAIGGFLLRAPLKSMWAGVPLAGGRPWAILFAVMLGAGSAGLFLVYRRWLIAAFAVAPVLALGFDLRPGGRRALGWLNETVGVAVLCLGAPAVYYSARGSVPLEAWLAWALCAMFFIGPIFFVKLAGLQHRAASGAVENMEVDRIGRASFLYHASVLAVILVAVRLGAVPFLIALPFFLALYKTWRRSRLGPEKVDFRRLGYQEIAYSCFFTAAVLASRFSA